MNVPPPEPTVKKYLNAYMDRDNMVLILRNDAGQLMKRVLPGESVAFFKLEGMDPQVRRVISHARHVNQVVEVGDWLRVSFDSGYWDASKPNKWTNRDGCWVQYREELCQQWEKEYNITTYEADVSPIRRVFSDRGLKIAKPNRGFLDLETDSRASFATVKSGRARILCWAFVSPTGEKYSGLLNHDTDEDEIRLLTEMWDCADQFDQVVAWGGDNFDFPVMKERTKFLSKKHDVTIVKDVRRWLYLDMMLCFKRNNISSSESGDEKQNFKLETIATALLGEGKHDVDGSKSWQYWEAGGEMRAKLLKYNIQDTDLMRRIEDKTGYLDLFHTLCDVCNVFPDSKALKPTVQVDGFMLRLGIQKGTHFPTKWFGDDKEQTQFRGAFVMDPLGDGIQKNVHVGDFASLYPAIMITWNLSPDSKTGQRLQSDYRTYDRDLASLPPGYCLSPATGLITDARFEGILSTALQELLRLRAEWNKIRANLAPGTPEAKEAERRTNAYKMAANSFYGVMGTIYARYYDRDISEATTQNGVWLIKITMKAAEERGWKVIYGDTDSLFIQGCTKDEFSEFVKHCNEELYPALLKAQGCRTNLIKLAYEKEFERIVFTSAKRYIGRYAHYKGKARVEGSKPEVKGLEYKRGDTNRRARLLQAQVIDMIDNQVETAESFESMLDTCKASILDDELQMSEIVVTKAITKELREYVTKKKIDGSDSAALPHVQVATTLFERGQDIQVGSRVGYVVVNAESSPMEVIPADDYAGECDRYYLWENLVYPPSMRLLQAAFPMHDWSKWEKVRPQKPRMKRSQVSDPNQIGLSFGPRTESSACTVETSQLVNGSPMAAPFRNRKPS